MARASSNYLREVKDRLPEGVKLEIQGNGHFVATYEGRRLSSFSSTPSSPRTGPNEWAKFERAWKLITNEQLQAKYFACLELIQNQGYTLDFRKGPKRTWYRLSSGTAVPNAIAEKLIERLVLVRVSVDGTQGSFARELPKPVEPEPEPVDPKLCAIMALRDQIDLVTTRFHSEVEMIKADLINILNEVYQ